MRSSDLMAIGGVFAGGAFMGGSFTHGKLIGVVIGGFVGILVGVMAFRSDKKKANRP